MIVDHMQQHIYTWYELLAVELDKINPPGCTRTNSGWTEEGLSRDHLATDSI